MPPGVTVRCEANSWSTSDRRLGTANGERRMIRFTGLPVPEPAGTESTATGRYGRASAKRIPYEPKKPAIKGDGDIWGRGEPPGSRRRTVHPGVDCA